MEFNDWEKQLGDRLRNIRPDYDPGSWDALQERLEADAQSEDSFDQELSERLRRLRPAFRADSWPRLAALLDREAAIVQTLLNSKAVELTVAFLVFLLLWEGLPTPRPALQDQGWRVTQLNEVTPNNQPAFLQELPSNEFVAGQGSPVLRTAPERNISTDVLPTDQLPSRSFVPTITPVLPELAGEIIRPDAPTITPATEYGPIQPISTSTAPGLTTATSPLAEIILPRQQRPRFRVGFIGTAWDFNLIRTNDVQIEESSKFISPLTDTIDASFISQGYSGGITFSANAGKWQYELGFLYTARPYKPVTIAFIAPDSNLDTVTADAFGEFEFNTIAVPLYVHTTLWQPNDKWRVYGTLGASLSVVTQANFYKASPEALDRPIRDLLPRGSGRSLEIKSSNLAEQAVARPAGWFEGGKFFENATLYGLAGFGVERYLNDEISLFFQPTYQQTIPFFNDGLGPYGDRINAFSMFLGMRYGL